VTYTLAKFASLVREAGLHVDFLAIWESQKLPEAIERLLGEIAEEINEILCNPPEGMPSNVTEWAKKEPCWDKVRDGMLIKLPTNVRNLLIDHEENKEREKEGARTQTIQDSIHAQAYVVEKGSAYWSELREWNRSNRKLTSKELGILNVACSIPRKIPTEKQAIALMKGEERAKTEGFFIPD
jgi:hypothetical protein